MKKLIAISIILIAALVITTGCVGTSGVSEVTTYVTVDENQQKLINHVNEDPTGYATEATLFYPEAKHLDWNPNLELNRLDDGRNKISLKGEGYYIGPVLYVTDSGEKKIWETTTVSSSPGYLSDAFARDAVEIYTLQEPPKFIDEIINP